MLMFIFGIFFILSALFLLVCLIGLLSSSAIGAVLFFVILGGAWWLAGKWQQHDYRKAATKRQRATQVPISSALDPYEEDEW